MKIVLLSPKGPLYRHRTGIFKKSLRAAPLTFSTLASLIPDEIDAAVKIIDEGVEEIPARLDADLVGMTVITGTAPRAYELAAKFRRQKLPVVLGGPHVTLVPGEAQDRADSIVTGYAEQNWPQLLRDFRDGILKPRYDMAEDFSLSAGPRLPFPRRDLMKRKGYVSLNTFEATRGCIHNCSFCVVPAAWGRRPFQKPIGDVIDDIRQTGAKKLIFYDLNLIADVNHAKELFRALIPLNIRWFGLATVLLGRDDELMELAAKSGCSGLLIGFESIDAASLGDSNKGFNRPNEYATLIQRLHSFGISINGTFVFGNDSDTRDSFDAVTDFVLEHRIDLPRFAVLTPFPGTGLFQRLEQESRIRTRDWSLYDGQHVVFEPRNMTAEELLKGHERAWQRVYSFGGIWERISRDMWNRASGWSLIAAANLGYRYYARNLSRFYTCTAAGI